MVPEVFKIEAMYSIEYLSHTADVRIELEATTLEELFRAGATSISEMLKPGFCKKTNVHPVCHSIVTYSIDATTLLIDFLSELLTLSYTEGAIFCEIIFEKLNERNAVVSVKGS